MKKFFGFLVITICAITNSHGQWSHDFSTSSLDEWSGSTNDFIVNNDSQLQLNAPAAGESFIYRSSSIDFDTVSFTMYHQLDFSPSDNNLSRTYLALDGNDPTTSSGYFIEIGENGSEDALKFYFLSEGNPQFIASASMGALAAEPATVQIEIDIYPDGLWSVKTNYAGDDFTSLELEFVDDQFSMKESLFFGLFCKYSASRADKFFYDDLSIQKFAPDVDPPTVVDVVPMDTKALRVTFSEPINEADGVNPVNYSLNNGVGNPTSVVAEGTLFTQFLLTFADDFDAQNVYFLEVSGVADLNDNEMESQTIPFLYAEAPELGDLLVSEILFDPYSGGEDFVEIFNSSFKNLDLDGVQILNTQNGDSKTLNAVTLTPGSYLALTEDVDFLIQEYKPEANANIDFQDLPAFNNDEGNVSIVAANGMVLDAFDYSEDQHFQLIDDTEGVSLERISFDIASSDSKNWQSASENVRFATPGYKNSSATTIISNEGGISLQTSTFSPNQDGEDDQMILNYDLDRSGYVLNVSIYDAAGFKIKELANNELLGTQGIITWDGTDGDNQIADLGMYIVVGKLFNPDGDTQSFKFITVLADFID